MKDRLAVVRAAVWMFVFALIAGGAESVAATRPQLSIDVFQGPMVSRVRGQLAAALCRKSCVPIEYLTRGGEVDWEKAQEVGLRAVLAGRVAQTGSSLLLELELLNGPQEPVLRRKLPLLRSGYMGQNQLARLRKDILQTIQTLGTVTTRRLEEPPAPVAEATATEIKPAPEPIVTVPAVPPYEAVHTEPPVSKQKIALSATGKTPQFRNPPVLTAELGTEATLRAVTYRRDNEVSAVGRALGAYATPRISAQFFPLAILGDWPLSGLGLEASWSRSASELSMRWSQYGVLARRSWSSSFEFGK